jgi:hypothetical protein
MSDLGLRSFTVAEDDMFATSKNYSSKTEEVKFFIINLSNYS